MTTPPRRYNSRRILGIADWMMISPAQRWLSSIKLNKTTLATHVCPHALSDGKSNTSKNKTQTFLAVIEPTLSSPCLCQLYHFNSYYRYPAAKVFRYCCVQQSIQLGGNFIGRDTANHVDITAKMDRVRYCTPRYPQFSRILAVSTKPRCPRSRRSKMRSFPG